MRRASSSVILLFLGLVASLHLFCHPPTHHKLTPSKHTHTTTTTLLQTLYTSFASPWPSSALTVGGVRGLLEGHRQNAKRRYHRQATNQHPRAPPHTASTHTTPSSRPTPARRARVAPPREAKTHAPPLPPSPLIQQRLRVQFRYDVPYTPHQHHPIRPPSPPPPRHVRL